MTLTIFENNDVIYFTISHYFTGGDIKLCDFGISGQLVDSIARTKDAGCRPYMAVRQKNISKTSLNKINFNLQKPERIDPQRAKGYDVRSDVWSLGITLMEVATGKFPYPKWGSVFEQLYQVTNRLIFMKCKLQSVTSL